MIELPDISFHVKKAMNLASRYANDNRYEFITPELFLWAVAHQPQFLNVIDVAPIQEALMCYFTKYIPHIPMGIEGKEADLSSDLCDIFNLAYINKMQSEARKIEIPHIIRALFSLDQQSFAKDVLLKACHSNKGEFVSSIIEAYTFNHTPADNFVILDSDADANTDDDDSNDDDFHILDEEGHDIDFDDINFDDLYPDHDDNSSSEWLRYVTCLNDTVNEHNPLIGRKNELQRTIQILCRKDKNNPLHVGEPGVGKTALAFGLAKLINDGDVPARLKDSKIYELDLGALLAGTQYRGEMEKRMKAVLDALAKQGNCILYIDEIHTIIGAGRVEGASHDASNILKRYLEDGKIRFMGATTYDEYNRYFYNAKGFSRRFEKIDIPEPSVDECTRILLGLKDSYETFHGVKYTDAALAYAVAAADKYINGKFLPDKAIDLIDEAGAWIELNHASDSTAVIDKPEISEVLAKICNVESLSDHEDDTERLLHLSEKLKEQIYGQDKAIQQVTEAVQLGSAGLIDENKPIASLLFVGPTGVGKTEVARVLAKELALPLLRFDMSEYAEKHTVAKLIGAPAGYVGYDDGGLLTGAICKTPHCVLLFDEIEKAHDDIYNILLQVMDYASLTDNKGRKADFRHVIFIMTTNAGAQFARNGSLGFVKGMSSGQIMMKSVKNTFKPEFINRLTSVTIFNNISREMAARILSKKISNLNAMLVNKNVTLNLDETARQWLLEHGFSNEYGGREIDRVITSSLKPLLMREILFGKLKNGGVADVTVADDKLVISE